jgi:glycosyltransferase involved in cell wall biosynthesis
VVESGLDSLTVRPKSPIELGVAMTVLARDPELRRRLGAAGLVKAQSYSWRVVTGRIIEVYQQARTGPAVPASEEVDPGVHHPISSVG